ncbi:glucose 1-dehydrogenase [Candidatus Laterigemmans baculatus]|uniref:glucose 1-dehydrogenase n=1 Tax=Candidatus Laterigemmans baculatus TaxID=2770505 RepID=UPI0013D9E7F9|nr:glucose 1-dehydrogenase [Candidatus Laterigemmans baculatus]
MTAKKRLSGKTALITGGSSGIGQAIAVRFAEEGANVAIAYRSSKEGAEKTAAAVNEACQREGTDACRGMIVQADVADESQVVRMFQEVLEAFGRLDIVVNNAGIQIQKPSHELDAADFDKVMGVNLRGAFLCSREALRHFRSRPGGGVILNDSSVHQIIPKPGYLGYSASKGGLGNLTRTLALEYAAEGIRVNAVAPGAIVTPMNQAWIDDPEARAAVESHIPMGRAGKPEEMAAVFAFLASDDASYITGQTIYADGGLTCFADFQDDWATGG